MRRSPPLAGPCKDVASHSGEAAVGTTEYERRHQTHDKENGYHGSEEIQLPVHGVPFLQSRHACRVTSPAWLDSGTPTLHDSYVRLELARVASGMSRAVRWSDIT